MYYSLNYHPKLSPRMREAISAIRKEHDPAFRFAGPHITVLFPIPERVGEKPLMEHIQGALSDRCPFQMRLGGLHLSQDHWLFLTLLKGDEEFKELYRSLYSGVLEEFRRDDIQYVPHVSLGLFLTKDATYDWDNPKGSDLDAARYEEALRHARALPAGSDMLVESLQLSKIPDEVVEWATGRRSSIPEHVRIEVVRKFRLDHHDT